ncbi:unnamed protein product [Boreogadus saida]
MERKTKVQDCVQYFVTKYCTEFSDTGIPPDAYAPRNGCVLCPASIPTGRVTAAWNVALFFDTWGDHAGPSHLVAVVGFFFRNHLRNWRDEGEDEDSVDSEDEAESGDEWSRGCPEGFYWRWRRKTAMVRTRHAAETRLRGRTLPQCVGSWSGRRPSRGSAGGVC